MLVIIVGGCLATEKKTIHNQGSQRSVVLGAHVVFRLVRLGVVLQTIQPKR